MFKHGLCLAMSGLALYALASTGSAQVMGGGATLPAKLYAQTLQKTPLPGFNPYISAGSGDGKRALLYNDPAPLGLPAGTTVDYAGSDLLLGTAEVNAYAIGSRAAYGPLIQIPTMLTPVSVVFNVPGMTSLDLPSTTAASIFAGYITNWNQLGDPDHPIIVVYRGDEAGTTQILLRHLNAVSPAAVPGVSGRFSDIIDVDDIQSPGHYVATGHDTCATSTGDDCVVELLLQQPYSISYMGPDQVDSPNPVTVARINGYLPNQVNVVAAVEDTPVPVSAADKADPLKWAIANPIPSVGYPIVASTQLLLSQCYRSATDNVRIRAFLSQQYNGTNDLPTAYHGFFVLPQAWKDAIAATFYTSVSPLGIGNSSVCAGIGRPV